MEMRQDLSEQRELFSDRETELLHTAKCGFVFSAGWQDGADKLQQAAREMGIDARVHVGMTDKELPFISLKPDEFLKQDEIDDFLEFCKTIGQQLVVSSSKEIDAARKQSKAEERWFGYGNKGLLFASALNTPTQTWTMLWSGGEANGLAWLPLLPRRPKK